MKINRITKSLIYDLSSIFFLFITSSYLDKIGEVLLNGKIITTNHASLESTQLSLYIWGLIYIIVMLLLVKRTQNSIVKLVKFLIITLMLSTIILYMIHTAIYQDKQTILIYLILILIVITLMSIKATLLVVNNRILLSDIGIEVKGEYGRVIQFNSIKHINIKYSLPQLPYRVKGVALLNIRKGRFRNKNGDDCFAYINLENPLPILIIDLKNDIHIFLNCKTPQQTLSLYTKCILILNNKLT